METHLKQTRVDSLMEAVCNVIVGSAIYTAVNYYVLSALLGIPISVGTSLGISALFTVVSITCSCALRRLFNGQAIWEAIKTATRHSTIPCKLGFHSYTWLAVHGDQWVECRRCGKRIV